MTPKSRKFWESKRRALAAELAEIETILGDLQTDNETKRKTKPKAIPKGLLLIREGCFGHRATTLPPDKELKAYADIRKRLPDDDEMKEQVSRMVLFYKYEKRRAEMDTNWWPSGCLTLLNKWDEVQSRAVTFLKNKPKSVPDAVSVKAIPEPAAGWREWANNNWPDNERIDFMSIPWLELIKYDASNNLGVCEEIAKAYRGNEAP